MSDTLGAADYRDGGLERLRESRFLLSQEMFAGSVYLAGRAVECTLRAIIWKADPELREGRKSMDAGQDLRELLALIVNLGVLGRYEHREALAAGVQYLARLWYNNTRYLPTRKLKARWWRLGHINQRRTMKSAANEFFNVCSSLIKRCEVLC
jgi:hypothetical protein